MEFIVTSCIIAAVIIIRIFFHYNDIGTISSAAKKRGWVNIRVEWAPFAAGAIFEENERNYRVRYHDEEGFQKIAYCKTSILSGVYWQDESI